jgi:tRNA(Ile2) C34 agmatinyltransferase TiaS
MSEADAAHDLEQFANAMTQPQCSECGGQMEYISAGAYCGGGWQCRDCGRQES